jgi:hypothetical protein
MAGAVADALQPFFWKGNQAVTKAELDRQRKVADALRPQTAPTGPWSLAGDLADEGVATFKDSQTSDAEASAQKAVADALAQGHYQDVAASDMATPQQSAVAQALWQQDMHERDPDTLLERQYKNAQIDALKAKPSVPPTDDEREYGLYSDQTKAAGGEPVPFIDYMGKVHPPAGGVTVNTGDNSNDFRKKGDQLAATRMDSILTEGESAPQTIGDLKTLAALGAQIDTGKEAEVKNALGPYAQALGIPIDGLPEMQAYQAITDRMAPQMRKPGSGASSDTDVKMFLSALPALGRTPEGNQIIIQTLTAIQKSKQAAGEIAQKAFLPPDQGGITWQEAERQIQALPDPYEGFSSYRKQADGANNATKITSDEEYDALPSGALYIDPGDGVTYRKP